MRRQRKFKSNKVWPDCVKVVVERLRSNEEKKSDVLDQLYKVSNITSCHEVD